MDEGWRLIERESRCDSPYLQVYEETVATPTRPRGVNWMVAYRKVAAVVAPRLVTGEYLLVRQERIAVRASLWEFPAGQVDGEVTPASILDTARRELEEEAGATTKADLRELGCYYCSPGFSTEVCHLFLASDVIFRREGMKQDEHEAILEVEAFAPARLREMIAGGGIVDANTLATFARLSARGLFA